MTSRIKRTFVIAQSLIMLLATSQAHAQQELPHPMSDSTKSVMLDEVIIIGQTDLANKRAKVLSSVDSYLETNGSINMIKRGAYAWEAMLNGMASERSIITIDGMRIYGACTDKMDPVTSYVEITNLSSADIHNGQSGAMHGATIAGGIDLVRQQSSFESPGFKGRVFTGFETNNRQKIAGTKLQYVGRTFFTDLDFTYRDAENYKAGGSQEILYSQFSKYNLSAVTGLKIRENKMVKASVIYDRALDVGYPALPMDVALAEAFISSLEYVQENISPLIHHWETKLYYNNVVHIMDDTKRPFVPIRMDMPGWTTTGGFYSLLHGETTRHHWKLNIAGHVNESLAEMTMFSNNSDEKDMFMLTWPGVMTTNGNVFFEDKLQLNDSWTTGFSAGVSMNHSSVEDAVGLESLKIFYPKMSKDKLRWLKNFGWDFRHVGESTVFSVGIGYGERPPSVSEAYGFYLFNSSDKYDYVGNPELKNEKSLEVISSASYGESNFSIKAQVSYFRMFDYIIGIPDVSLLPMTIGASGIKVYGQLNDADIVNTNFSAHYSFIPPVSLSVRAVYRSGIADDLRLPQIQPFSYGANLKYEKDGYVVEANMDGALSQVHYSKEFGEAPAAAYTLFGLGVSKVFSISKQELLLKAGVENAFDVHYSTFADWNRIPRMGRNIYFNIIYSF